MEHLETIPVTTTGTVKSQDYDCLIVVLQKATPISSVLSFLTPIIEPHRKIIKNFAAGVHVIPCDELPYNRLILSFTGQLDREYDDNRRIVEAARDGLVKASKIGALKPVLALDKLDILEKTETAFVPPSCLCLCALLGCLQAAYVPLEAREFSQSEHHSIKSVKSRVVNSLAWLINPDYECDQKELARAAWCLEEGRRVARDIGGSDPERMSPKKIVEYLEKELTDPVEMTHDCVDGALYPMAAAVDRGSNEKHSGRIVTLEYDNDEVSETDQPKVDLFLVGKGITYDTGGHDIKTGGRMITMHRDKCGAAAVAGFFKVVSLMKPKHIAVHGKLALVRNSIGENAYVSDEIVTSRAGMRVRVGNTDAEGRMVMTDLLCKAKEEALMKAKPHLFTIATLTGHVRSCYGKGYTAIVSNAVANSGQDSLTIRRMGELLGEMHEVSTLRREDFSAFEQSDKNADLANTAAPIHGLYSRGHQGPAAFMMMASRLDGHSVGSEKPLPYTHFDIAGSAGPCPGIPTAVPILTLSVCYLLDRIMLGKSE